MLAQLLLIFQKPFLQAERAPAATPGHTKTRRKSHFAVTRYVTSRGWPAVRQEVVAKKTKKKKRQPDFLCHRFNPAAGFYLRRRPMGCILKGGRGEGRGFAGIKGCELFTSF